MDQSEHYGHTDKRLRYGQISEQYRLRLHLRQCRLFSDMRYIDETEIYNTVTGEVYPDIESIPAAKQQNIDVRILKQWDIVYEATALVDIPSAITYRYYGNDKFVMGTDTFRQDIGLSRSPLIGRWSGNRLWKDCGKGHNDRAGCGIIHSLSFP